jgi:ABC-type transporter Mla subunit MlaD
VTSPAPHIPEDIEALRAAYIASQEALIAERAGRAAEQAALASAENTIAHLKKLIARLQHDRYGASSERSRKLIDQLELQLDERGGSGNLNNWDKWIFCLRAA